MTNWIDRWQIFTRTLSARQLEEKMRNMLSSNSVFIVRSLKSLLFIVGPPKSQQISAEMHLVVWLEALKKVEMSGDTLRQKIGWNKTWIALRRTWQQKIDRQVVDSCSRIDNCHYHFHCKHVNNRPRDRLTIGFVIVIALIIIIDHYHYHYHCNCHNEHGTKEWEAVRGFQQQDWQSSAQLSGDER